MTDRRDLEGWYDEHAQALFGYLLGLTRDEADTHDLLQGVFVRLARDPGAVSQARDPRAYLLRLAHNLAVDLMRRRTRRAERDQGWSVECFRLFAPSVDPDESAFREALAAALAEVPEEQRAVVQLKLWEGRTFAEIAALLDIPLNTAASRYRYALDKLQTRLRPLYEELQ